ncbi:MAG: 3-keto-5-aminohexanoate cleavage protein [Deltaproteobacteria bacterium]|nr:3-keto-5-aminohexanoate cleavage protein [Deltaproteobacteria bacterium]
MKAIGSFLTPEQRLSDLAKGKNSGTKIIVTAAITGSIHTPTMSPDLPITPQQIADEVLRVYQAGGAVAHIHVRNPETGQPSSDMALFREVLTKVKSRCNIILCLSTGAGLGMTTEERLRVVSTFQPEMASLNCGSMNFGIFRPLQTIKDFKHPWEKAYLAMTEDFVFPNTFKTLAEFFQVFSRNQTKPELEIYDAGMISNIAYMIEQGHLKTPIYLQFVLGILGGILASPHSLIFLRDHAREVLQDFVWSVCGAGRHQIPLCTMALTLGGNVRVGMEDSLYVGKGIKAKSNAEQVEKVVRILRELSLEPATPDEARQILGLKGLDKVNW